MKQFIFNSPNFYLFQIKDLMIIVNTLNLICWFCFNFNLWFIWFLIEAWRLESMNDSLNDYFVLMIKFGFYTFKFLIEDFVWFFCHFVIMFVEIKLFDSIEQFLQCFLRLIWLFIGMIFWFLIDFDSIVKCFVIFLWLIFINWPHMFWDHCVYFINLEFAVLTSIIFVIK